MFVHIDLLLLLHLLATFNNLNILPMGGSREKERKKERGREKEREREREEKERETRMIEFLFLEGHYLQWGEDQRGVGLVW